MTNKIVIVDDDTFILNLVRMSFKEYPNYEIITVEDSLKAEDVIQKEQPSLVIIDLYMPNLNGLDLGYQLKSNHHTEDIPIMFMSGHPTLENAKLAFFLGAIDLIEKPFKPDELVSKAKASVELCELKRLINKFLGVNKNGNK